MKWKLTRTLASACIVPILAPNITNYSKRRSIKRSLKVVIDEFVTVVAPQHLRVVLHPTERGTASNIPCIQQQSDNVYLESKLLKAINQEEIILLNQYVPSVKYSKHILHLTLSCVCKH